MWLWIPNPPDRINSKKNKGGEGELMDGYNLTLGTIPTEVEEFQTTIPKSTMETLPI